MVWLKCCAVWLSKRDSENIYSYIFVWCSVLLFAFAQLVISVVAVVVLGYPEVSQTQSSEAGQLDPQPQDSLNTSQMIDAVAEVRENSTGITVVQFCLFFFRLIFPHLE